MLSRGMFIMVTALLAASFGPAGAKGVMPKTLVVGYEDEGHVDASEKSCREFVTGVVEWEEAEVKQAVRDVCAVREKHVAAYAALQKAYKAFYAEVSQQTRLEGAEAAAQLATLIQSCISHKFALTTGGHNIGTDMIPNEIAASCLALGTDLLAAETRQLRGE